MAVSLVHYEHFYDKAPLCWELERIESGETYPAGMTRDDTQVTCPTCVRYLNES